MNLLGGGRRRDGVDAAVRHRREIDRLQLETDVAGHAARHVQDVVDELRLRLGVPLDRLDRPPRLLRLELTRGEDARPSKDGAERRAQLVRDRREEFVLQPVQLIGLAEQPRVLDRERDAPCEFLDERDVVGRVFPT